MPIRTMRGTGGLVFHILNRGVRRLRLFDDAGDYAALIRCFAEAQARVPVEVFAYCLMPNHFHLVLRPLGDGHLAEFMRLATVTHSKRWHQHRGTAGTGAVYQGRYKAFAVQTERYFFAVCRYVEANPLRAGLVPRAEDWAWSSAAVRRNNVDEFRLSEWPILPPTDWLDVVNQQARSEVERLRQSVRRSAPLGDRSWTLRTAELLGVQRGIRRPGRPKKTSGVVL